MITMIIKQSFELQPIVKNKQQNVERSASPDGGCRSCVSLTITVPFYVHKAKLGFDPSSQGFHITLKLEDTLFVVNL